MTPEKIPTGLLEFIDSPSKGLYISDDDIVKYSEHLNRIRIYLEDNLDQNMVNYCDFVAFLDLYKLVTEGSTTKNYVTVCNCSN